MKTEIISQEKNPFLEREELIIKITGEAMPTKEGIIDAIRKDKDATVVRKISSNFGKESFVADIVVYSSVEAKDKYMTIPKKIRAKMEADKKAAEEAAKKAAAEEVASKEAEEKIAAEPVAEEVKEEPAAKEDKQENTEEKAK
jgi:ribosomal protein S24E